MSTLIFDDAGHVWDHASPEFRATLHYPAPDFELRRYVTDILGFTVLSFHGRSARLQLRPGITSPIALAAALFALADDPPERLVLSHPDKPCGDEVFIDIAYAFARIAELMDAKSPTEPVRFLREEQRIEGLLRGETPLSLVLWRWRDQNAATPHPRENRDLLESMVHGRFMIVETDDTGLRIIEVGGGFRAYDQRWRELARGAPVELQPDHEYGVWVRQFYETVATRREPYYDHVDALIRRPHRRDVIRARYQRLIVPFAQHGSGRLHLLGVSVEDATIDLRSARRCQVYAGATV